MTVDRDDDLLGGRTPVERADTSRPETTAKPTNKMRADDNAPLPLNALTRTKARRELLDYFLTAEIPESGYNKSKMARESGVSANRIRDHIDVFLDMGLVVLTSDEDAHIKRYRVNSESRAYVVLREANEQLYHCYQQHSRQ